jgi:hypothetical protein
MVGGFASHRTDTLATATYDYRPGAIRSAGAGCGRMILERDPLATRAVNSPAAPGGSAQSPRPVVISCSSQSSLWIGVKIRPVFVKKMSDGPSLALVNSGDMKSPNRGEGEVVVQSRFINRAARACGMRRD